jgi:PhnB protein
MHVQPYLYFDGRCEEALDFYRRVLGARVGMMMRFKESPEPDRIPPGSSEKIMHASFRVGDTELMASDGGCQGKQNFAGFALSLTVADEREAERLFAALGEGGRVQMPLAPTFFAARFGMLADRFGVSWIILVPREHTGASA